MDSGTRKNIEKAILIGLIAAPVLLSPMGGKVILNIARYHLKKWWEKGGPYIPPEADEEQVRLSIYNLKRRNYIQIKPTKKKNVFRLELTAKGRKFFNKVNVNDISIAAPKKWDGRWRFFLFDVPEKYKNSREILRDKLKKLNFFLFQKSVWIHPFACEKELNLICDYLGMTPYTMTFAAKIENDRVLRRYFLRQGVLLRRHVSLMDKGVRY